jgi:hypothetical protein
MEWDFFLTLFFNLKYNMKDCITPNPNSFLFQLFFILAFWNTFPIGVVASESNKALHFNELQLDTISQNKDLDSLELGNGSFKEIIDEKFIEGPESVFSKFIWLLVKITGVFMWIGLMIIIFYHSYRILKNVFSKKD